ncbi:MAG TPA: hypothetical protein VM513_33120 [Kofleriaceae bacterium]|jgi:hypothetical protein|nr:hypothetical protein [Kofleriaceae bacterium]
MATRFAVVALVACGGTSAVTQQHAPAEPTAKACVADGLGPLQVWASVDRTCVDDNACERRCNDGDPRACLVHAYAQQEAGADSDQWFARACQLGSANACTNLGASLWLRRRSASEADTACAKRLFERACQAREPFGCGMAGRMLAAEATTPAQREAARRKFDDACNAFGAMSCRMYALHLENGDLGPHEPATVRALMLRACNTGDEDACGHETADETFVPAADP